MNPRSPIHADGPALPPEPLNSALEAIMAAERSLIGRVPLPVGVSLIGLARR